ncbi:MAG: nitrate reductase associated protein [Chitinophagaceae bacterium]
MNTTNNQQIPIQYFKFEEDFIEDNIRCIPMIVRFKLDACGIKLKLKEWSKMNEEERISLAEKPCNSKTEIQAYKAYLMDVVVQRTSEQVTELAIDNEPVWMNTENIPDILKEKCAEWNYSITINQWKQLSILERFVLLKLSRPSHENANFPKAMIEFGLVAN